MSSNITVNILYSEVHRNNFAEKDGSEGRIGGEGEMLAVKREVVGHATWESGCSLHRFSERRRRRKAGVESTLQRALDSTATTNFKTAVGQLELHS
jgi:hypothetical protein